MNRYNSILLNWDMGDELRGIYFIRQYLTRKEQVRLGMIFGHGGGVVLYWKKRIPERWLALEGKSMDVDEYDDFTDHWSINNEIFDIKSPSRYISKQLRYEVLNRQKWMCNNCGKKLKYSEKHEWGDDVAHIDHIHPFSKWDSYDGDINEVVNLQALCSKCNKEKYNHKN